MLTVGRKSLNVKFADGAGNDAFQRLRVSEPATIFESSFKVDKLPHHWVEELTGTACTSIFNANHASVDMTVGTASGNKVIRQTNRYLSYHPGKSMLLEMTGTFPAVKAGNRARIGYFDDNNGLFFQQSSSGMAVVQRGKMTGTVANTVFAQSSWNIDKLDGTGPSGHTVDFTKAQIYIIDFQWLGVGRVRFGVVHNGQTIYCHHINNDNVRTTVYMSTGDLPIRYEIENTAATASSTLLKQICSTCISEGGWNPEGVVRSAGNGIVTRTAGTAGLPVISLRKKSANVHISVQIQEIGAIVTTIDDVVVEVWEDSILNSTASWVALPGVCEMDLTATSFSNGTKIYESYLHGQAGATSTVNAPQIFSSHHSILGCTVAGASDTVSIVIRCMSGTANVAATISYREIL